MEQKNNSKFTADQEENVPNLESTVFSENTNIYTRPASVASDKEANVEKTILTDNDVEMRKTLEQEAQKSHETVKTQPSFRAKENPLKHSASRNVQDEVQAKRIRLQSEDKESTNKITSPPPVIAKKMDLKSPSSFPKIQSIESVHYNIIPITSKPVQRNNALTMSSHMFSASHYEYCDSEISFDQISKGCNSRIIQIFFFFGKFILQLLCFICYKYKIFYN